MTWCNPSHYFKNAWIMNFAHSTHLQNRVWALWGRGNRRHSKLENESNNTWYIWSCLTTINIHWPVHLETYTIPAKTAAIEISQTLGRHGRTESCEKQDPTTHTKQISVIVNCKAASSKANYPWIFPFVRHGNDVAIEQVLPLRVTTVKSESVNRR